ncbi:ATP-binding protein [Kineococcus aurantiacus]|uniref:Anti-sigma regulatory factor (Ser/Thr protein kinase) n=1 Tax=Kineococcus aurantiacus TaxID=37633 RepID=A0A7Y9DNF0_9ACTN|nr:ATP-binding protein [Kineococcus aurantiacus]NYD23728.1 anti-sigma regulatory factor (Ser/Thr protein kinase) [Kineococcus aurantiacus]
MCEWYPAAESAVVVDRSAARHARRFLDDHWCVEHASLLRPHAELVVSELVTEAVTHGAPPVLLRVECEGADGVTISVSDRDPNGPRFRTVGPDGVPGTNLVAVLSDEWGVRTRPGGKTVWSRLVV